MNKTAKTFIQLGAAALAFLGFGALLSRKDKEEETDPNEVTVDQGLIEGVTVESEDATEEE